MLQPITLPIPLEEKQNSYFKAPSGGPLVQHSLVAMLELWHRKIFTLEKIVEKMCHNPAILFNIKGRGFIREGYKADLCLVNPDRPMDRFKGKHPLQMRMVAIRRHNFQFKGG